MRRRRVSDSDDEEFRSKRDRVETDTVESLIYRVGSKDLSNIEKDITDLASLILLDIPKNSDTLIRVLTKCVKNIPERMLIYATMIGLINLKNRVFVNQFIEALQRELKDAVKSAAFEDAKFIMLFLSTSVNCYTVTPDSVMGLYENFAEVTLDVGRSCQARTDFYAYSILYSLPYGAHLLAAHDVAALNEILGTIAIYLSKRHKNHVSLLRVWDSDDPHPQEDYLDCLWAQIRHLQSTAWREQVTWRLYDSFPSLKESGHPHHLSPLTPPDYDPEVVYPIPRVIFRMFDYTDVIVEEEDGEGTAADLHSRLTIPAKAKEVPILPGAHTIERFLIDEQLCILMNNLNFNRTLCAKAMLNLRTRARVALDYMIVEAVFGAMFNLPNPPVQHGHLLFYGSLLIQLCQEDSDRMPLVLAQATELLYERLDGMKPVCIGRMIEWFSYHLSNNQLQWSWREWSGSISEDYMSPHRRLITETFARLIRFSYYDNVKRVIPKSLYPLLPTEPNVVNKYDTKSDLASAAAFYQILDAMRTRASNADVLRMIQRVSMSDDLPSSPNGTDALDQSNLLTSDDDEGNRSTGSDEDVELKNRIKNRPRLVGNRRLANKKSLPEPTTPGSDANDEPMLSGLDVPANQLTDLSHGVTNLSIELFFSALFIVGHKTISHSFAYIKRYGNMIRTIAATVENQVEALHVLQTVWANQPQMIVIITEHMCRMGLLDPESIVRWAYSPIMTSLSEIPMGYNPTSARPRILDFYVWECLNRTLFRVGRRVDRITNRLNAAKELLDLNEDQSGSSSPGNQDSSDGDEEVDRRRHRRGRSKAKQKAITGFDLVSSDDDIAFQRKKGSSGSRVARLEETRCEAVRSQCAVITLLLHRHARLTSEVASELADDVLGLSMSSLSRSASTAALLHSSGQKLGLSKETLEHIAFWLKGRLVEVVLEHFDQLLPYLDNLDEFICGAHPEVQDVFQQLRSLHS